MDELHRSINYSKKRLQAIRNCQDHIAAILWSAASKIVSKSSKYRAGNSLENEDSLLRYAKSITRDAEKSINGYISEYSKASCKILGIGSENIESFLVSDIYGKTTSERNIVYLENFAEDIVRMVKAGVIMGYSDQQLLSSIRTGYKDPYHTSVITKAKRKDINIDIPSYGKGYCRNAYQNIVRNASQVIALAWGRAEQEYGRENKAIGYFVYRGSSYYCPVCDDLCGYMHPLDRMVIPAHVNCVCRVQFTFKK